MEICQVLKPVSHSFTSFVVLLSHAEAVIVSFAKDNVFLSLLLVLSRSLVLHY